MIFIADVRSLLCECAVDEGDSLAASAGCFGTEGAVSETIGDLVGNCPCNCVCAVGAGSDICEVGAGCNLLIAGCTEQEGDDLATSANCIRVEGGLGGTLGDALLDCPQDRVVVYAVLAYVGERVDGVSLDLGRTGCAVQEGDDLCTSAAIVYAEGICGLAGGYALVCCPDDCIVVGAGLLNVLERVDNRCYVVGILLAANGADAILELVAECRNNCLSGENFAADGALGASGQAGLGAGCCNCCNFLRSVASSLDYFASLEDLAAPLADGVAGVAVFGAGCCLNICKLISCGVGNCRHTNKAALCNIATYRASIYTKTRIFAGRSNNNGCCILALCVSSSNKVTLGVIATFTVADIEIITSPAEFFASRCLGLNLYEVMAKLIDLCRRSENLPVVAAVSKLDILINSCSVAVFFASCLLAIIASPSVVLYDALGGEAVCIKSKVLIVLIICELNAAEILITYIAVPLIGHASVLYAVFIHVRIVTNLGALHCISMGVVQAIEVLSIDESVAIGAVLCCLVAKSMANLVTLDKCVVIVANKIVHCIRIVALAILNVRSRGATNSQGVSRLNSCFPNELIVNELASENIAIVYVLSVGYECILILVTDVGRCKLSFDSSLLSVSSICRQHANCCTASNELRLTALVANSVAPAIILAGGLLNDSELSVDVANLCDVAYSDRLGCTSAANCAIANSDARLLAGSCLKNFVLKGVTTVKADVFLICERCNYSIKNLAAVVADLDINRNQRRF